MNSRQGDPNSFVVTNNVKATFEGCISVTEATWIPHRIRFPEIFNTTTTYIYPFSRRVYRQQVDLDPHYLYYHSWRLGKVLCIKRQKRQSKENTILQRKKINYEKRTGIFWLIIFFYTCTQRGQTGWLGESLERLSEELRAWILKQGHFPTNFHSNISRQQDKYFLCPAHCASLCIHNHTWYLSFFLHGQKFWSIKFTPKKRGNYDKIHSKLPIFCVITRA